MKKEKNIMQRKTMFYQRFSTELRGQYDSVIIDFSTELDQYLPLILFYFLIFWASGGQLL